MTELPQNQLRGPPRNDNIPSLKLGSDFTETMATHTATFIVN